MMGVILAAGKASRFPSGNKALVEINKKPNIINIVNSVIDYCDLVYVITNNKSRAEMEKILKPYKKVKIYEDNSFSGTGGVLRNFIKRKRVKDDIIVGWGDSIIMDRRFIRDLAESEDDMTIPVCVEEYPYVSILVDSDETPHGVLYSKSDYRLRKGYHDMSFFKLSKRALDYLEKIKEFDGEYRFLDLVNILYTEGLSLSIKKIDKKPVYSFNTKEKLEEIKKELNL